MEFQKIKEINERLTPIILERENKKTGEKTKSEYNTVNQRILAFRELFPNGSIQTEILKLEDGACVVKATAYDEAGKILATGHAHEEKEATLINKKSFVENCETSAVGRCLGIIGIGATTAIASVEEMQAQKEAIEKREKEIADGMKRELIDLWVKAGGEKEKGFDEWFQEKTKDGFGGDQFGLMKAILLKKINDDAEKKKNPLVYVNTENTTKKGEKK